MSFYKGYDKTTQAWIAFVAASVSDWRDTNCAACMADAILSSVLPFGSGSAAAPKENRDTAGEVSGKLRAPSRRPGQFRPRSAKRPASSAAWRIAIDLATVSWYSASGSLS